MASNPLAELPSTRRRLFGSLLPAAALTVVLTVLFSQGLHPDQVLFSNDGPLGTHVAYAQVATTFFTGAWHDLNWLGGQAPSVLPSITFAFYFLLGPLGYSKFFVPITLLVLGLSAWVLFRQLRFRPWVCLLGALAAALNTDSFSYACWGLPSVALVPAMVFLALAAIHSAADGRPLIKLALAGMAVGMGVMEGFDVGAIFSLYVAVFTLFFAWNQPGPARQRLLRGVGRLGVVAACAVFLAAQALSTLIATQIQGVVGMQQDTRTKEQRWNEATQWSLPKVEALRIMVPGLFGYRMDTPDGGAYWGAVGQDPGVTRLLQEVSSPDEKVSLQASQALQSAVQEGALMRHSGSGEYAGVLVVLLAVFALFESLRGKENPFSSVERKCVWFWSGAVLISLLLAFGRFAPFYRVVYALPYFSVIRNPVKFLHPLSLGLVVLFGYGLAALDRKHLAPGAGLLAGGGRGINRVKQWWNRAPVFDRRWGVGMAAFLAVGLLGWLLYASSRQDLTAYLQQVGFGAGAASIAVFSLKAVGWFILFLGASAAAVLAVMSGLFSGPNAKWGGVLLGLVLVADLGRANEPWIVYYNYREKYASNPIVDFLRHQAYQKRVTAPVVINIVREGGRQRLDDLWEVYRTDWLQHLFQYYDVQSLDIIQMPREKRDYDEFMNGTFNPTNVARQGRLWQLTSTRYLLGLAGAVSALNQTFDPVQCRFRLQTRFTLTQSADGRITTVVATNGPYALIEDGAALPRVGLYSHWQVITNDQETLQRLADPGFDPEQTVLVADPLPSPSATNSVTQPAGAVTFTHYEPKAVRFHATAERPALLLFNDHFDPAWRVRVDGRPEKVLRCNYLMRGVLLPPGEHTVEFRFAPTVVTLYLSLAALTLGAVFCALLVFAPGLKRAEGGGRTAAPTTDH